MKKFKILYLFLFITLFLGMNRVKAQLVENTGVISQAGTHVIDPCYYGSADPDHCYGMAVKYDASNSTAYICTEYKKTSPAAGSNISCTITDDWDNRTRFAIATLIKESGLSKDNTQTSVNYFAAEMAINKFLYQKYGDNNNNIAESALSSTYRTVFDSYMTILNNAYDSYSETELSLSTTTLTFTKSGSNYVSNNVVVTSNVDFEDLTITANIGIVHKNVENGSFNITIPVSLVTSTTNVTVQVKAEKELIKAREYDCGSYQSLTPIDYETVSSKKTLEATGTIRIANLKIAKVDQNGSMIASAKLSFKTEAEKNNNEDGLEITTTQEYYEIEDLATGRYYLSEKEAPKGYYKTDEVIEIVVNNQGEIFVNGTKSTTGIVRLENDITEVVISKISIVDGKELPGATLQVLDFNKEEISCIVKRSDDTVEFLEDCKWVSEEEPVSILGLEVGKYYLTETIAPEGYALNQSSVAFEITLDGPSDVVKMENTLEVEVPNTLSSRSALLLTIAMFDIALGLGIITYVKRNKVEE